MDIGDKIIGFVLCIIGFGMLSFDYLIFTDAFFIYSTVEIIGLGVLGVHFVGWIFKLVIMILLFVFGLYMIILGLNSLFE